MENVNILAIGADYGTALLVFFGIIIAVKLTQAVVITRLEALSKKTASDIDDHFIDIAKSVRPAVYIIVALLVAAKTLTLSTLASSVIDGVLYTVLTYQAVLSLNSVVEYLALKYIKKSNDSQKAATKMITMGAKIALWVSGVLFVLHNLGVNITSLVAGLGIGGVAVAFALQNILDDIFSSFALVFDKPFKPGDFIVTGDDMGVVEKIGIKTTRIRALQGEELVISNRELTSTRIQNFKKMEKRRIVVTLGIGYGTPNAKIKKALLQIKKIISSKKLATFDRAHFNAFGDSALMIEVVYYVDSPDYNEYMDINQDIHLSIKEYVENEGIEIAYPTQTVYIRKDI